MHLFAIGPVRVRAVLGAVLAILVCTLAGAASAAPSTTVVISQVYGGGGNTGSLYKNDFIELHNLGTTTVNLSGWSVQYAATAGTNWSRTDLSGDLDPGEYFLIQEAQGTGGTVDLPTPDATGTIAMSATAGKVVLVNTQTTIPPGTTCPVDPTIVDKVGYGTGTNCFEGAGPTGTLNNTNAAFRVNGGCLDSDENSLNFTVAAPAPRNTSTPAFPCDGEFAPAMTARTPAAGALNVSLDANVTITFSEPVNAVGDWFAINCTTSGFHAADVSGGPTTFTLDPETDFAGSETCGVVVVGAQVHDQDTNDPPDTLVGNLSWQFTTAAATGCAAATTHQIAQVQGSGTATPLAGQQVRVEGVVTGDFQASGQLGGFFFQDDTPDSDPATSDGLFAFSSIPVSIGDRVRVTGSAIEFNGLTELSPVAVVDVCGSGGIAPAAYDLPRVPGTTFEPVENVLVTFPEQLAATEHFQLGRFGEVHVSSDGRLLQPTDRVSPGAPATTMLELSNRRRLLIDDGSTIQNPAVVPFLTPESLRIGDTATGITGVMSFGFGLYRLQPTQLITFARTNPRPATPEPVGGEIRVASFNTLNYFTTLRSVNPNARGADNATEFSRQQAKEVAAITGLDADIVGLMEMENNGETAISNLVDALNAATEPGTYAFVRDLALNAPNEFGGTFGPDAIKVALIYRPAAVTPVGPAQSSSDPIFDRPPLIQRFRSATGSEEITLAVNHFKSKSCTGATGADLDQSDGQSCFNARRIAQANTLSGVLDTLDVPSPLIIGDLNAYTEEDPIHVLEQAGYTGLSELFVPDAQRYSFVFDGLSGELDHGLAGSAALDNVTGATIWHINADEPLILDYNTEFNPPGLYAPDAFRSSDHDPFLIGLSLNDTPTADAGELYSVAEGGTVALRGAGTDPEGDVLSFAWDLDGDGSFEAAGKDVTFTAGTLDGPAMRTVRLRVTDGATSAVDDATVTIENAPPTATFSGPASSFAGFPFTLSLAGASDPSAADTADGFEYSFDCGSGYGSFGASASATCPTSAVGDRSVGGKIRDKDGGVTEYRATVRVVVTFDSLCELARAYSTDEVVADELCHKLAEAEAATNAGARARILAAFRNYVDAKIGKGLTAQQAAILKSLSTQL